MLPANVATTSAGPQNPDSSGATIIRDDQACLPLTGILTAGDIIVLLTPVVVPPTSDQGSYNDPFESLGLSLAKYHKGIKHVPYTARNGITSIHVPLIKAAKAVIFVISGPPRNGQPSQVEIFEVAKVVAEHRPQIIVACCSIQELGPLETSFPTIVQISGYSKGELETAANLLFGNDRRSASLTPSVQNLLQTPRQWRVEIWNQYQDLPAVYDLWCQCMPDSFCLNRFTLQSLLDREGYAKHYVVRDSGTREVLGFCGTYTTFFGSEEDERLIGCLACVIVRPAYRRMGIGTTLHDHALREIRKTRGVTRLKLGSTFPRLFYGFPSALTSEDWFRRRGWRMDSQVPGAGQEACDWLLRFDDWPTGFSSNDLTFRPCSTSDMDRVKDIVIRESGRNDCIGWYDQYARLGNTFFTRDIIICLEGDTIIATALTYSRLSGSPVADDLPWAASISDDVGGVTCICIADDDPALVNSRDTIMIGLLDACVRALREQNMKSMFIDAVLGGYEGFQSIGFQKWARYRDVWREV